RWWRRRSPSSPRTRSTGAGALPRRGDLESGRREVFGEGVAAEVIGFAPARGRDRIDAGRGRRGRERMAEDEAAVGRRRGEPAADETSVVGVLEVVDAEQRRVVADAPFPK